jgi:plastocyanin
MGTSYAETYTIEQVSGASTPTNPEFFVPPEITIEVGDTVAWKNSDAATHTVTSGSADDAGNWGAVFDSGLQKPGGTFEHTFTAAGEYPFLCQLHPWMLGKIIVTEEMEEQPEEMPGEMPMMLIPTDNGSVDVEVTVDKGMVHDSDFMVDPPQEVKFDIKFLDPTTGQPLQHVNYMFEVVDPSGKSVVHKPGLHVHEGMDSQSVAFAKAGSFTLSVNIEGTGINKPFDTKHSGLATSTVMVTPEFPLSVLAVMAGVVGIGIAATRFRNALKL